MSRVIIRVTPLRALVTLLITYLLSPLPLQVQYGFRIRALLEFRAPRFLDQRSKFQGLRIGLLFQRLGPATYGCIALRDVQLEISQAPGKPKP